MRAAGNNLPDVFSYWAGARTQFVVDSGNLHPIDEMWKAAGLDDDRRQVGRRRRHACTTASATWCRSAITMPACSTTRRSWTRPASPPCPTTWDEFKAFCDKLKAAGVAPIALGSKNRWPAQFWFDYLLLRTAGPEYRAKLMAGDGLLHRPRGDEGDGHVEGAGRCGLLRRQRQCR